MSTEAKLLSDAELHTILCSLNSPTDSHAVRSHIAALTQQRDDARKDAANWKHSFEAQNSELQRLAHDAEDKDDAIERLAEIGRAIGCDHHGDPDGRSRLVSCVEETIANFEQQLAEQAEWPATGHCDYTKQYAWYAAELAVGVREHKPVTA